MRNFPGAVAGGCDVFCLKVFASWNWKILASHAWLDDSRTRKVETDVRCHEKPEAMKFTSFKFDATIFNLYVVGCLP